jgi:CheY-like chemotaxis protein
MRFSQSYVLVLAQPSDDLQMLECLLEKLRCPAVIARSPAQAMARANQTPPYLVILSGNHQSWMQSLVSDLRSASASGQVMIVALTDFHAPSWLHQEEHPGLDGLLVKPLSGDVLTSLVQSAWARQACYWAS